MGSTSAAAAAAAAAATEVLTRGRKAASTAGFVGPPHNSSSTGRAAGRFPLASDVLCTRSIVSQDHLQIKRDGVSQNPAPIRQLHAQVSASVRHRPSFEFRKVRSAVGTGAPTVDTSRNLLRNFNRELSVGNKLGGLRGWV